MKRLSKEFLYMLKEKADIVNVAKELGVKLSKSSDDRWMAPCPFPNHRDSTPSFSIFVESQEFHCFGCHEHGDVVDLVSVITGKRFYGAVMFLAERMGLEVEEIPEDEIIFGWEDEEEVSSTSPDDLALFDIIELRNTLQKIAGRCGAGSDEFDSAFQEAEELYRRLEHATSPVVKILITGRIKELSAQLRESYLEDNCDRRRSHGSVLSLRSHTGQ